MVTGRKEAILSEWAAGIMELGHQLQVFAGRRVNTNIYQEFLRQHVVP